MMAGIMIRESRFARDEIGVLRRWPKTLCSLRDAMPRKRLGKCIGPETAADFRADA